MVHSRFALATVLVLLTLAGSAAISQSINPPPGPDINAVPFEFDPQHLNVVAAEWKGGIGCQSTFDPLVCPATGMGGTDLSDNFGAGLGWLSSGFSRGGSSSYRPPSAASHVRPIVDCPSHQVESHSPCTNPGAPGLWPRPRRHTICRDNLPMRGAP
jgi:hypothetical protein